MIDTIRLIAGREITTKLRDRAFIISSVVMLLLVAGGIIIPALLTGDDEHPSYRLAVAGQTATSVGEIARTTGEAAVRLADEQEKADDEAGQDEVAQLVRAGETGVPPARVTLVGVGSTDAATAAVRDGTADAALVEKADGTMEIVGTDDVDSDLSTLITLSATAEQTRAVLADAGVGDDVIERLGSMQAPSERLLEAGGENEGVAQVLGFAFAFLFYFTAITFGMTIAQSVVEEKQSRVIEILVAATPVRLLLAGKILGNAALALGQVALLLAIGLAAASATGQSAAVSMLLHSGGWFLLFFAFGFIMLSCAWAAAGSLAARQEDLQSTTVPMQILLFAPFLLSFYLNEPGTGLKILSYVPFTAPLSMPRRLLIEDAAWWEALLSLGVIVVTGALLIAFAARLYEGSLLRTSTKTSIATAWKRDKTSA
ncbi:ABC transporter permease [Kineosporia sp. J2-2]|uniref:ABC transporter permease n=1 Tax=Kineosporia corallincola TaxID=2835133 RepID=A0ABS5TSM0_9ACTN|nr:ABC transporter permease [Kineosporia corallincola]MBT0773817.1 ABC transporter permease [Kineosporia corallincola]